ncbi:MAG: outer membrane lipoprotein-sorting protein [Deltaproteobacteria bacterium]|nr:MAG: outer membrane lipoprotein-sorting protein [Deltaproteobacteria bacterium]
MRKDALKICFALIVILTIPLSFSRGEELAEGERLVRQAVEYYRGLASISVVEMTVHRPSWERRMVIKAWTKGISDSLFVIVSPKKDRGNGTLKKGREMWTYNPKVNRVVRIPPSMMSQSWMGSDFSNNDLAKSDSILTDYVHRVVAKEVRDGHVVYTVESIPKPDAPVVWGKQVLKIRDDAILLLEEFYDEEMKLVKRLTGFDIQPLGGKLFPKRWKMEKVGEKDEYTLLEYRELRFVDDLPDYIFTVQFLRNPKRL